MKVSINQLLALKPLAVNLRISALDLEVILADNARRTTVLLNRNLPQQFEIAQHLAGTEHHTAQRIVGNRNRQSSFFADALVQVFQQRTTAGEYDAAIANICRQLRRRTLQR